MILDYSGGRVFGASFTDKNGSRCSITESSLAEEPAIRLGVEFDFNNRKSIRMHLTQDQVADLLPHLQRFAETGRLKEE